METGGWTVLGAGVVAASFLVGAAFYLRIALHALRWTHAALRDAAFFQPRAAPAPRQIFGALIDVLLLRRLFAVNPALWPGEWLFHAALGLVLLRHLRYFTQPVPAGIEWLQTAGWIAGFLLPAAVAYVLVLRLAQRRERHCPPTNILMLLDVLGIAVTGLLLATRHRVDLVQVKAYALGIVTLRPVAPPADWLLAAHLALVMALVLYLPSHVLTAPLTMLDARRRESELQGVLHDA